MPNFFNTNFIINAQSTNFGQGSSVEVLPDMDISINIADILFVIIGLALGVWFAYWVFKKIKEGVKTASLEKKSLSSVLFEVRLPKSNEIEIQAADQMLSGFMGISSSLKGMDKLFGARNYISFEIVAFPDSIRFYVNTPKKLASLVEKQINGSYPDAEVIKTNEYNLFSPNQTVEFCELKLEEDNYRPIRNYEELPDDPLNTLTSAMSKLSKGEASAIQIVVVPAGSSWRKDGKKYVSKVRENNSDPEKSKMDVDEDVLAGIERKCEKSGFAVDIRLVSVSPDSESAKSNLDNMLYAFDQFSKESGNKFTESKIKWKNAKQRFMKSFIYRFPEEKMILNTAELATIYHFPNSRVLTPNINWLTAKRAPANPQISSKYEPGSVYLGLNEYRGSTRPIYMKLKDRQRHFYYVGKTGSGKTVMLQHMILQDIRNGQGLAFLDPHGDAVEWLLDRIPPERVEDLIYFNPADYERPIGINILEWYSEVDKHIVVNGLLGLMNKLFDPNNQGITGPRFEQAVRNACLTVMSVKGTGLMEAMLVLQNDEHAKKYFPYINDDVVMRYWTDQIAKTQEFHKSEVLGYIVSKFDRFLTNKMMRNIVAQGKSGFDFRKAMDSKKILLVNLSKGLMGEENSQFMGLLLIPKILQAAMSRADIPENERKDFFLYVDEFQNFATPDFAQILSEARKYKLNLVVANQYIAQMSDQIRDAVFGNAGSIGSFKVGVNDAQYLANEFDPVFNQNDLINLENLNMYIKLLAGGEYHSPFSLKLDTDLVFNTPPNKEIGGLARELSRLRYGKDRKLVEAEVKAREEDTGDIDPSKNVSPQPPAFKAPLN